MKARKRFWRVSPEGRLTTKRASRPFTLSASFVRSALRRDFGAIGNRVLYNLCAQNPRHSLPEAIGAKVLLIGRTYAAAIERRKNVDPKRAQRDFYPQDVVPVIRRSKIDQWFDAV